MASSTYVESPCEDEGSLLAPQLTERKASVPTGRLATLGALTLLVVGFVATCVGSSGEPARGVDAVELDAVDPEHSEVQIDMDITGIQYTTLDNAGVAWTANDAGATPAPSDVECVVDDTLPAPGAWTAATPPLWAGTKQDLFRFAVQSVVARQLRFPVAQVTIDEPPVSASGAGFRRTTFTVRVTVPEALTATAVIERLNDGSTLMRDIKARLSSCRFPRQGGIGVQSVFSSRKGEALASEIEGGPAISFGMDIRGMYYQQLSLSESLKDAFVDAVRSGIVPSDVSLQAESIGLDITNGGVDADDVPYVHVEATIPVPDGLTADATMSKWPGGRTGIGDSITENLNKMTDIARVTKAAGDAEKHKIVVYPGPLFLGGLRQSYRRQIQVPIEVFNLDHDTTAGAGLFTPLDQIRDRVREDIRANIDKDADVIVEFMDPADPVRGAPIAEPYSNAMFKAADPLTLRATISQADKKAALPDTATWLTKLLPAIRRSERYFKTLVPAPAGTADARYRFAMRAPVVSQAIDTVDIDMVVNGIDYTSLRPEARGAFRDDLVDAVHASIFPAGLPAGDYRETVRNQVKVAVSSRKSTDSGKGGGVNVRASIPAPTSEAETVQLMANLERDVDTGAMTTRLQNEVRLMTGISYVSTWSSDAVTVSVAGFINDFSGDVPDKDDAV